MIKSFDLISDIHLDMHVHEHNKAKESSEWGSKGYSMESYTESQFIEYFVTHQIAATDPSEVLVIAGDLGHDNFQNKLMLEYLSKVYKNIVITFGNHDLYLIPRYARQEHSTDRWNEMKRFAYDLNNVSVLEGNVVELGGVRFGGTGMWYDYSLGLKKGWSHMECHRTWMARMNDSVYIRGLPVFEEELEKLRGVISKSDVIVTHVAPDFQQQGERERLHDISMFYYFDPVGLEHFVKDKIWCHGHVHLRKQDSVNGCRIICNALGYPQELRQRLGYTTARRIEL